MSRGSTTTATKIVGIDPEVAQAIADKLGLKLEIMDMDFDSIITAVSAGKADMGMAGMTVTEDRKKNVDFSQTYASAIQAIIVPEGSDIKTADDMEGKKIGVMQGFTGDLNCTEQFGEDSVVRFNKSAEAVMALRRARSTASLLITSRLRRSSRQTRVCRFWTASTLRRTTQSHLPRAMTVSAMLLTRLWAS